jgi:hypothetical protein
MTRDVVFTDARNGIYPTQGKVLRVKPGSGCAVPFLYSGHPSTSMLIPLRLVWDVNSDSYNEHSPPSDFLMIYPYVNTKENQLFSYEGNPSHFPLIRFECEFTNSETPTHVEVIPAANATRDGIDWQNEQQKLTQFPSLKSERGMYDLPTLDLTPDDFLAEVHTSSRNSSDYESNATTKIPIMPRHVLLEGKLKQGDKWEILDEIELPFSYYTLPYPLYRLTYKRKIKYVRFTVMSIYMSLETRYGVYSSYNGSWYYYDDLAPYPNLLYSHLYFPKMDFFSKPGS